MNARTTASSPLHRRGVLQLLAGGSILVGGGLLWQNAARSAAEEAVRIPSPAQDMPPPSGQGTQKAIFAGGCFWGVQGVFQHVKGVQRAVSGYSGGTAPTASYDLVSGGRTGHAESVEITYDPAQVSYGTLLQIFFSVVHDPTQLNRQGPDTGTQYRSAIFATNEAQLKVAQAYVAQLEATRLFGKPIVTRLEASPSFFPAETYHQDFLTENPRHPYIVINDLPKVANLKRIFPDRYRGDPVLVKASR
ncbi:peptide-methionine (S)-S-oxide reductase MsrA [Variovorax sp. KK3]|uniref:peptide-methionine (S)-S-oxide reductase MsrA n=1 Tax=Variovorax sp. KK3 TaxID=1855728 RepID=UPI00097C56F3|nr:peptide-methionine (S)-S-oxide reductase MsrA [Variovorax sp. KK3]